VESARMTTMGEGEAPPTLRTERVKHPLSSLSRAHAHAPQRLSAAHLSSGRRIRTGTGTINGAYVRGRTRALAGCGVPRRIQIAAAQGTVNGGQ
jgi:hypothetical protein